MLSYMPIFGMPATMFTVTIEDGFNFRVRVMANAEEGTKEPANHLVSAENLREFGKECASTRINYPGLCAIDFERMLDIIIEDLIGWDTSTRENKKNFGLFGDIDAWTYAVEEQGRKTLHAHFLLWVTGYNDMIKELNSSIDTSGYMDIEKTFKLV